MRQKSKGVKAKHFLLFGTGFAVLIGAAFIYLPGFSRFYTLSQEENGLDKQITEIHTQIRALEEERDLLQNDLEYLEKVIREELGLVKPGEIIYKLVPEKKSESPSVSTPPQKNS